MRKKERKREPPIGPRPSRLPGRQVGPAAPSTNLPWVPETLATPHSFSRDPLSPRSPPRLFPPPDLDRGSTPTAPVAASATTPSPDLLPVAARRSLDASPSSPKTATAPWRRPGFAARSRRTPAPSPPRRRRLLASPSPATPSFPEPVAPNPTAPCEPLPPLLSPLPRSRPTRAVPCSPHDAPSCTHAPAACVRHR